MCERAVGRRIPQSWGCFVKAAVMYDAMAIRKQVVALKQRICAAAQAARPGERRAGVSLPLLL